MRDELPSAIGHCAFLNCWCYSLGRLTVPTAVTAIGFDAFALRSVVLRGSGDSLRYKAVKPRVKKRNKTEPKVHSQLSMAHAENSHCCPCPTQVAARTSVLAEELFQAPLPPTMQVMLLAGSLAIAIDPHVHVPQ